jgi:hypothetical protein
MTEIKIGIKTGKLYLRKNEKIGHYILIIISILSYGILVTEHS